MGIPGLLGVLKSVTHPVHISEYRDLTAGVDAFCWLHRGTFSCGMELCTGIATDRYVAFCMKRVNLLRLHGVEPLMVFDGASLPMKSEKHLERRRQRDSARSKGEAALAAGEVGAAAQHFSKAAGVTHDMAFELIKALRRAGVKHVVAPYEADAQLAYLNRSGAVDVVITEDSDCLPYGCKKVLFKMDNEGHGQEIQLRNLAANVPLSLRNWKNSMFLDLCLLAGCDYITAAVKGLGIITAHKLVDRHRSLDKIIRAVQSSKFVVPEEYWEQYKRARLTFRHHIIYDPQSESTVHLMPLGDTARKMGNLDFLGSHLPPVVAQGVAAGRLLPTTHRPYERAASLDHAGSSPPPPPHGAELQEGVSSLVPTPPGAKTGGIGELAWKQHLEPASSLPAGTLEEGDGRRGGHPLRNLEPHTRTLSAQPALSDTLIDRPFCAGRPALAELQSPTHAETPQGSEGWSEAMVEAENNAWGLKDDGRPSSISVTSGDRHNRDVGKAPYLSDFHSHDGVHAQREQTLAFGMDMGHASGHARGEMPCSPRMRDADSVGLAGRLSPVDLPVTRDSFSRVTLGSKSSLPVGSEGRGTKILVPGWGAEGWREGYATGSEGPQHGGTMATSPIRDVGWGDAGMAARQPVWGENVEEDGWADTRQAGRRCQAEESAIYGCLPKRLSGWMDDAPPAATTASRGCASLAESSAFNVSESHDATGRSSGEVNTREGVGTLALTEPPDADRAKFVPPSAQHFQSTQVSQGLETLQRRKRRLCPAGDELPGPPSMRDWPGPPDRRQQRELGREDAHAVDDATPPVLANKPNGPSAGGEEFWMIQPNARTKPSGSSTPRHGGRYHSAEESKGISSFRTGTVRGTPLPHTPVRSVPPSRQDSAVSPARLGESNRVWDKALARESTSRRWTVPVSSTVPPPTAIELPLLRLLGSTGDLPGPGRLGGRNASQPSVKPARGTEFWDERLMR